MSPAGPPPSLARRVHNVYLAGGAIENDHFRHAGPRTTCFRRLAGATSKTGMRRVPRLVCRGAIFGPSLLVNVILSLAMFGVAVALTYLLAFRASGSALVAAVRRGHHHRIYPRLYNTNKGAGPHRGDGPGMAYVDEPDRKA
jgi:hypothetical protein